MSDTPRTDAAEFHTSPYTQMVAADFARQLERENASLRAEVTRLKNRLEINYVYDSDENKVPFPDDMHPYDGIECRDTTIKGQDRVIADLRARLEQTEAVVDAARELLALKAKKDLYRQLNDNGDRSHSWGLEFELEYQRKKPMLWKALADALCALSPTEESK